MSEIPAITPNTLANYSAATVATKAPASTSKLRTVLSHPWTRAALREPLLHFAILGAAIFAVAESVEHYNSQYRVEISNQDINRLAESYRQQYGALPSDDQLDTLVKNFVKEEILYREALSLDLHQGDEIVRRRLAQKFTFLQQDLALLNQATTDDIRRYYDDNLDRYTELEKRSFSHVYFSPDGIGDSAARARAESALAVLRSEVPERAPELGDVFPGSSDLAEIDFGTTERLFGKSELAEEIYRAPVGSWAGPFRSGFGWHLVRVGSESPSRVVPFEEVQDIVRQDLQDSRRDALNQQALDRVTQKYSVIHEGA
jgi:peptidyl-prolyl cis-trans isomerase C